jgi:hypothetical protein
MASQHALSMHWIWNLVVRKAQHRSMALERHSCEIGISMELNVAGAKEHVLNTKNNWIGPGAGFGCGLISNLAGPKRSQNTPTQSLQIRQGREGV